MELQCESTHKPRYVQYGQRIVSGTVLFQIIAIVMMVFLYSSAIAEPTIQKQESMSQVLTETDNGKIVELHIGSEVVLRLPENAATGYRWTIEAVDESLVEMEEGEYLPMSDSIGSGGEAQWIIRAKATGVAKIKLKRWRRWEGESSVQARFNFTLRIVR